MKHFQIFLILLMSGFYACSEITVGNQKESGMFSERPAIRWQDALVSGNGEMGVLVFGDPADERVIINHEMLYEPIGTEKIEPPDIAKYLEQTRKLIAEGKYEEATAYSLDMAKKEGYPGIMWTDPYHPACVMHIRQPQRASATSYRRSVDFTTGEIKVQWRDGDDQWERNTFVSRADGVIVQEIRSKSKQKIDGTLSLRFQNSNEKRWSALGGELNIRQAEIAAKNRTLVYRGGYTLNERGYEVLAMVVNSGGSVRAIADSLQISDTDHILILSKVQHLEQFSDSEVDKIKNELSGLPANYEKLLDRHAKIHKEMFSRVQLDITPARVEKRSSEQMIADQKARQDQMDLELLETMFDMGRYAFISSSGNNPPNLMGIWNGEWRPAWSGDFTLDANINLQISAANLGNLHEGIESYTRLLERIAPDWEINAGKIYGARGYLSGTRTSGRRNLHTHFSTGFPGHFWTSGAEWLLYPSFEYFLTSADTSFLQRIYPMMKKTAMFFEDFLVDTDDRGYYIFSPSYSPENRPGGHKSATSVNATIDIATTKELLSNLIYSAEILGVDQDKTTHWRQMLKKLPPYLINEDGALKEWAHLELKDNYNHRHVSHLYPAWPGLEISPDEDKKLFNAAIKAAELRGRGNGSAHGLAHMALIGARLKDPELVFGNLNFMMSNNYLYTSLFTSHNPGRIYNSDMLCSLPAVIMEMLVFSKPGEIELLPALSEKIRKGSVSGIKCRTFATADYLSWDFNTKRVKTEISSIVDQQVKIRYRKGIKSIKVDGVLMESEIMDDNYIVLPFKAGSSQTIEIEMK